MTLTELNLILELTKTIALSFLGLTVLGIIILVAILIRAAYVPQEQELEQGIAS